MTRIKREQLVGEILCRLTEVQRVLIRKTYVGSNDVLLLDAFDIRFSNKTLGILTTLCQSRAENDAICIQRCITKLNTDYVTINQILMSSTNLHLEAICRAYESKFEGSLLEKVKDSIGKRNGTYHQLLTAVVNCVRTECHPRDISRSDARKDAKHLYQMLEKQKTDKIKVVQILTHQSWLHINEICKYYTQISNFDIRTRIEKQFGARSFNALSVIIDYSRSRHAFYAQILQKSMKGLGGTSDDMLIRVVVGRSGIDLGQICKVFTRKYADGKTLLQWLRGATSGTFCKMLCKLTNIGDEYISDIPHDDDELTVSSLTSDIKEDYTMSSMTARIYSSAMDDISWDEFVCTSPTIKYNAKVEIAVLASELIAVLSNPKQKKDAKQMLIDVIATINCSQRKELNLEFKDQHPDGMDLRECIEQVLKKGKTKSAISGLMQEPAEFYASALKQAIRLKKVDIIFEIICQCSNAEISQMKIAYSAMNKNDELLVDIQQLFIKNTTAKMMIHNILNGERNESIGVDRKMMREHVEMLSKKKLTSSKEKGYLAELLVKHSFTHLEELIHKFNETSEISFPAVCKVVIGTGFSGQIADNIIRLAINRYGYFAQKLRESMKKIGTDDAALMRILIGRCEKDLGDIVHAFSEHNEYGEGKTLKQWLKDNTSGSFQSTLLRISGLHEDNMRDYDYTDSDGSVPNSPLPMTPREVELKVTPIIASTDNNNNNNSNLEVTTPMLDFTSDANASASGSGSGSKSVSDDGSAIDDDLHDIQFLELADFMSTKMNIKSVTRMWKQLKITDLDSVVEVKEVINILLFSCVLFCAWKSNQRKGGITGINKKKLKSVLKPVVNWIIEERMNTISVRRDEFVRFGMWVKEYAQLKDSQTY